MGVKSEIRWLKELDNRVNLFILIAKEGATSIRELRGLLNFDDWWPVKCHVKSLEDKGLIEKAEGGYRVTDSGAKTFESLRTVHDIESV